MSFKIYENRFAPRHGNAIGRLFQIAIQGFTTSSSWGWPHSDDVTCLEKMLGKTCYLFKKTVFWSVDSLGDRRQSCCRIVIRDGGGHPRATGTTTGCLEIYADTKKRRLEAIFKLSQVRVPLRTSRRDCGPDLFAWNASVWRCWAWPARNSGWTSSACVDEYRSDFQLASLQTCDELLWNVRPIFTSKNMLGQLQVHRLKLSSIVFFYLFVIIIIIII